MLFAAVGICHLKKKFLGIFKSVNKVVTPEILYLHPCSIGNSKFTTSQIYLGRKKWKQIQTVFPTLYFHPRHETICLFYGLETKKEVSDTSVMSTQKYR